MDKEKKPQAGGEFYALVAWGHANRKQLTWTLGAVLVAGLAVGLYFMHNQSRESAADEAFSALKIPLTGREPSTPEEAAQFMQVANDYPGTSAGAHALLVAGGIYFEAGKYADAQDAFQRFLAARGDSPLANSAAVGVAASLELQGKGAEAAAHFESVLQRPSDSTWPQAKSALARLYVEQGHPDRAFQEYKEMLEANNNDSWTMEARVQAGELLEKYPALRQQLSPPPSAPVKAPVLDVGKP